ncbi:uncharacterized protein LOC101863419 [Aplysia californica]|uniref:Uncharacterized protein LOC101863419 n=1 Tax=Aplysia californica TaxID=6500 RepID=A0ABM1VQH4_APLCA|nr:uncharacterized protein LOC101863419 [Aplysia californica]
MATKMLQEGQDPRENEFDPFQNVKASNFDSEDPELRNGARQKSGQQQKGHPFSRDFIDSMFTVVDRDLLFCKLFYFFFFGAFGSLFPLLAIYFKQLGMNASQSGVLIGFRPFVEFLSAPFWGGLADKWRRGKEMLLFALLCWIVFTMAIAFVQPPAHKCLKSNGTHNVLEGPISRRRRELGVVGHDRTTTTPIFSGSHLAESVIGEGQGDNFFHNTHDRPGVFVRKIASVDSAPSSLLPHPSGVLISSAFTGLQHPVVMFPEDDTYNHLNSRTQHAIHHKNNDNNNNNKNNYHHNHHRRHKRSPYKVDASKLHHQNHLNNANNINNNDNHHHVNKRSPYRVDASKIANANSSDIKKLVFNRYSTIVYHEDEVQQAFFILLLLVIIGEFFSAPAITFADSVTLSFLGEDTQNYGRQRMFGSLGWGLAMFFVGMALDHSTTFPDHPCGQAHQSEKNYTVCFAVFSVLMSCAFLSALQFRFDHHNKEVRLSELPQKVKEKVKRVISGNRKIDRERLVEEDDNDEFPPRGGAGGGGGGGGCQIVVKLPTGHVRVLYAGLVGNIARFFYISLLWKPWWVLPFEFVQGKSLDRGMFSHGGKVPHELFEESSQLAPHGVPSGIARDLSSSRLGQDPQQEYGAMSYDGASNLSVQGSKQGQGGGRADYNDRNMENPMHHGYNQGSSDRIAMFEPPRLPTHIYQQQPRNSHDQDYGP